jgi:hypothetical protein
LVSSPTAGVSARFEDQSMTSMVLWHLDGMAPSGSCVWAAVSGHVPLCVPILGLVLTTPPLGLDHSDNGAEMGRVSAPQSPHGAPHDCVVLHPDHLVQSSSGREL